MSTTTTEYEEPKDYQHEGATENTNYFEFEDREGDEYYDDKEWMPVWGLVLIIFACGMIVAGFLFFLLIRNDRIRREEQRAKLESRGSVRSTSGGTSSRHLSSAPQMKTGE